MIRTSGRSAELNRKVSEVAYSAPLRLRLDLAPRARLRSVWWHLGNLKYYVNI